MSDPTPRWTAQDGTLVVDAQAGGAQSPAHAVVEVVVSRVFVRTLRPSTPGSVIALDLRLSESVPPVRTLARVVRLVNVPGDAGMEVELLDVWGTRAAEQLSSYLTEAEAHRATRSWTAGAHVLVVDDNATYRELAADSLRDAGFDVQVASNGFEALSLALKHRPNLLISDVTMPNMDGFQLLRMLRARPELRRLPVMFLTDRTNEADRLRGYELGVDDFVTKPFTSVELITRIERLIERSLEAMESPRGMRGGLGEMPLSSLLGFIELERRTGVLQLHRDGESATLYIRDGEVLRIDLASEHDALLGIKRFFHLLDWTNGSFELTSVPVRMDDALQLRTQHVLMEHARVRDERDAGLGSPD